MKFLAGMRLRLIEVSARLHIFAAAFLSPLPHRSRCKAASCRPQVRGLILAPNPGIDGNETSTL